MRVMLQALTTAMQNLLWKSAAWLLCMARVAKKRNWAASFYMRGRERLCLHIRDCNAAQFRWLGCRRRSKPVQSTVIAACLEQHYHLGHRAALWVVPQHIMHCFRYDAIMADSLQAVLSVGSTFATCIAALAAL